MSSEDRQPPPESSPSNLNKETGNLSWAMLLALTAVIVGSLSLFRYNVLYTEGEVMQWLFTLLVGLVAGGVLIGVHSRKVAAWFVILFGGTLLLWQAYQFREWTVIHEEIVTLVRFAEDIRTKTGRYPTSLDGYTFKNSCVRSHIHGFGLTETGDFQLTYFLNNPGITYWYSSKTGFGYYPD